jgi:hypothetical protein
MTTTKKSYIVHLTDVAIETIERGTAKELGVDDFLLGRTVVDLDALRLVLDAANETAYQAKYGKGTIESWVVLQTAIAKLEHLTR